MSQEDKTKHHPVLPSLRENHNVGNFSDAGRWIDRTSTELDGLSRGLNVVKMDFEVNSIPDMWARPLLFEMALLDTDHQIHKRILGEWRGLLAMLALKELRGINDLRVVSVEIPALSEEAVDQNLPLGFLEALRKLAPAQTLSRDTSWRELNIILYGEEPIGITSPTTLVCTATDCHNRIDNIPWFSGRYLRDPGDHLSIGHKRALADWLDELRKKLVNHQGGFNQTSAAWTQLSKRISEFIKDLGRGTNITVQLSDSSIGMKSGIFVYLDRPVRGGKREAAKSHVRLLPSRKDAPAKSILVADKTISDQWGVPEHDILVWGDIPLDRSMPYGGLARQQTEIAGIKLENAEVWTPKAFFTDKLFVVNQENAFPGAREINMRGSGILRFQGEAVTPILPIPRRLLDYLNTNDLSQAVSFEQSNDGIIVRLRLTLSGTDLKGEEFEITQVFRSKENEIILINNVPVLEVWPDFKIKETQAEASKSNSSHTGDLETTPSNQEDVLLVDSKTSAQKPERPMWKAYYTYYSPAGETDTFYAEPYASTAETMRQTLKNSRSEIEREVIRMNHFPEAMICNSPVANTQSNRMENHLAGVILLKPPKETSSVPTKSFRVGIDFGATNTNVYAREEDGSPYPIVFKKHFLQITASGNKRTHLYDDFLPGEEEDTPFQSIFHDLQLAPNAQEIRPLLDGHIFFLLGYTDFRADTPGFATDLKWSEKADDSIRTRSFLEQLCLQSAAEAVIKGAKEIEWAYSFPTAFSVTTKVGLPETWKQIIKDCSDLTGIPQKGEPVEKTESEASALFFRKHNASTEVGTVCIDIGGSTSDIAIWQHDKLCWQTSLRFAGRDMFLNLLRAKPGILRMFGIEDVSELESLRGNSTAFYAQADALISHQNDEMLKRRLSDNAREKSFKEFTQPMAIGLSGIFYYVGLLLRYLVEKEKYKKEIPDIYVGGNASRLFHWLAAGDYNSRSAINGLFKGALLQASQFGGESKDFNLIISPLPKAEAAYGLVVEDKLEVVSNGEGVLAGEVFLEGNEQKNWDELLIADKFKSGLAVPSTLERLKDFLEIFDGYAKSTGTVGPEIGNDASLMRDIRQRVMGALADYRKYKTANSIHVEPIFILALKNLLAIKTES